MRPASAGFVAAGAALIVDQLTKALVLSSLEIGDPVPVIGRALQLSLRFNSGAAFSLRWGGPVFLSIFTAAAVVIVFWYLLRRPPRSVLHAAALGLILGGATGNLVDRLLHSGSVIDFLDAGTSTWRWPTFNVADSAISIGAVYILLFGTGRRRAGNT